MNTRDFLAACASLACAAALLPLQAQAQAQAQAQQCPSKLVVITPD
jgi:hypothetical protein